MRQRAWVVAVSSLLVAVSTATVWSAAAKPTIVVDPCPGAAGATVTISWNGFATGSLIVDYTSPSGKSLTRNNVSATSAITVTNGASSGSVLVATPAPPASGVWYVSGVRLFQTSAGSGKSVQEQFSCVGVAPTTTTSSTTTTLPPTTTSTSTTTTSTTTTTTTTSSTTTSTTAPPQCDPTLENTVVAEIVDSSLTQPWGIAFNPSGSLAFVATLDSYDVVNVIDTETNTIVQRLTLPDDGYGMADLVVNNAGTFAYVTQPDLSVVWVLDLGTYTFTKSIAVGGGASTLAISPDDSRLYVANYDDGTVTVIDTSTESIVTTIGGLSSPFGLTVNPAGTAVYVADYYLGVVKISTATNTITATIGGVGVNDVVVSPDGSTVYAADYDNATVRVISAATDSLAATVSLGAGEFPYSIAIDPDGGFVFTANYLSDSVSVVDTSSNTLLATVETGLGSYPIGVAVNPAGTYAYVTYHYGTSVAAIALPCPS